MRNNAKQRQSGKLPGGITGRGFVPGRSGNPNGRPRTRGLLNALSAAMSKVRLDGRSIEEMLVDALIEEALGGKHRVAAISTIFDRLEGKPKQTVEVDGLKKAVENRTPEELRFWLKHKHWPEEDWGRASE